MCQLENYLSSQQFQGTYLLSTLVIAKYVYCALFIVNWQGTPFTNLAVQQKKISHIV